MHNTVIQGMGMYAPGEPISNSELKLLASIDFDETKIEAKLGIKERHIAKLRGISESAADFAEKAVRSAITDAGIDPQEVDLFIVATDTPEYISPATALLVQGRIQKKQRDAMSFDVNASCAGFATAFDIGSRLVATDPSLNYAVVSGVYNMPAFVRDKDSFGLSIFADGAGSVVLKKENSKKNGYMQGHFLTDGTQWDYLGIYSGGAKRPVTKELLDNQEYGLQLLKALPGNRNIELWPPVVETLLKKGGLTKTDLDHILFTQINRYVIEQVMAKLKLPMEKTTTIMDRYGYTGSACLPMALFHAVKAGRIKRGERVMFVASGAGLSVGSNLFTF